MKLSIGIPDIQNTRQAAQRLDKEVRDVIELLCDTVDALTQNQLAQADANDEETDADDEDFDIKVFSVQDMIDNGIIKTYRKRTNKKVAGTYNRRN